MARTPQVRHDEAREIVAAETGRKVFEITREGERTLCDWALKTAGIEAAFVYAYPRKSRPFYTLPAEGSRAHAFDPMFRGLEITSGGMSINRHEGIVENAKAFGLEYFTQKMLGLARVKGANLFRRDRKRTRPQRC